MICEVFVLEAAVQAEPPSAIEEEQVDLEVGADVVDGQNRRTWRCVSSSTAVMKRRSTACWKTPRVSCTVTFCSSSISVFSTSV